MSTSTRTEGAGLDAALLAVIANRLDSVCREMTNTLLRSGRSAVLNMARDFSCSLVTGDNQMLASAEGLPVHVFGSQFLSEAMCNLHPDLAEGDAFLHNDVYLGNTHSADHTILVPVFVDGEHLFTCCAKAHQADCGNSLPTTYAPFAGDVYEEGALNFPCVQSPAQLSGHRRHHPDVPAAYPCARPVVWRLPGDARCGTNRRAPAEGVGRQVRHDR